MKLIVRKFGIALLLLLISGLCRTQEIDSLKQLYYSTIDRQKRIDILNKMSYQWMDINIDSAKTYADEAYQKAITSDYLSGQIKSLHRQCYYYLRTGDSRTAIRLIEKSESLADKIGDKELLTNSFMIHGDVLTNISAFDLAIKKYLLALDLSEITKNNDKKMLCLNRIGILHSKTGYFEKSLEFYQKAINTPHSSKNKDEELWLKNNIAGVFADQNNKKKALEIYQQLLDTISKSNNKNLGLKAAVLDNIASIYSSFGDINNAKVYFKNAIKVCDQNGDVFQRTKVLLNECNLLLEQKKHSMAEDNLIKIFDISVNSGWSDLAASSARFLSQVYEKQGYLKKSLLYLSEYIKYSEIREKTENTRKMDEIQLRYDLEKEALEIEEKSRRKSVFIISILIISLISVSFFITLLIHFKTRAKKAILKRKNLELEQERIKLEHQNIANKLELSKKEVVSNAILLTKKNDLLNSVAEQLMHRTNHFTKPNKDIIDGFVKELQQSVDDLDWESIEKPFNQVYESFYRNLYEINPNLTANDKRLCAYIKLKMRSKEIAGITNSSLRSVEIARYRLRKKLRITDSTISLNGFLSRL